MKSNMYNCMSRATETRLLSG